MGRPEIDDATRDTVLRYNADGKSVAFIAEQTGLSRVTIYAIFRRTCRKHYDLMQACRTERERISQAARTLATLGEEICISLQLGKN